MLPKERARSDLIRKRLAYQAMPTLRRIVHVSTVGARLDVGVRGEDGVCRDETVEGFEEVLETEASLTMAEIYEDGQVAMADKFKIPTGISRLGTIDRDL